MATATLNKGNQTRGAKSKPAMRLMPDREHGAVKRRSARTGLNGSASATPTHVSLAIVSVPADWRPTAWDDQPPPGCSVFLSEEFDDAAQAECWCRLWNTTEMQIRRGLWIVRQPAAKASVTPPEVEAYAVIHSDDGGSEAVLCVGAASFTGTFARAYTRSPLKKGHAIRVHRLNCKLGEQVDIASLLTSEDDDG